MSVALLVLAGFLGGRVYQLFASGPGLFAPTYASDAEVRAKIEKHDYLIPEGATNLTYLMVGFEEPSMYISMKLPLLKHQTVIEEWLKRSKGKIELIEKMQLSGYDPNNYDWIEHDLSPFELSNTSKVSGYKASTDPEGYEYAGFSNAETGRVILYSWFE